MQEPIIDEQDITAYFKQQCVETFPGCVEDADLTEKFSNIVSGTISDLITLTETPAKDLTIGVETRDTGNAVFRPNAVIGRGGKLNFNTEFLQTLINDFLNGRRNWTEIEHELRFATAHECYHVREYAKFPNRFWSTMAEQRTSTTPAWISDRAELAADMFALKYIRSRYDPIAPDAQKQFALIEREERRITATKNIRAIYKC